MSGFPTASDESVAKDDFNTLITNVKYNPFVNLLANASMEKTTHGDLRCDYWIESGVVNERSSTQKKFGGYSLKISPSAITDHSYQDVIAFEDLKGIKVAFGCWVYAPDTNVVLRISDGVGTTDSSTNAGTGAWEFLYVTRTISDTATRVRVELRPTDTAGDFYFDGAVLIVGEEPPRTAILPVTMGDFLHRNQVLSSAPSWTPEIGDTYFDTTDLQEYRWTGSAWEIV